MFNKLVDIKNHLEEINQLLMEPEVINDNAKYRSLMKEYKNLTPIVEKFNEYLAAKENFDEARAILDEGGLEPDFKEMVQAQYKESKELIEIYNQELKVLLLPKDENDERDVIVEIRAGAGGEEATLFAYNLYRMYNMYAASKGWKTEILSLNETESGGFKEVSFSVVGDNVYGRLKYEGGVHRVQRVPDTEAQGRVHTSTATVAIMLDVDDVEIDINPADLKVDTFRSSGAGGQHINKTSSAIRITHIPTGVVIECQGERSQHQNRAQAMKMLRSRLYDMEKQKQEAEVAQERKEQVGTGDRSERIRTYNYPQGRLSEHRIGLTIYRLEQVLNGDLDEIIDSLITAVQAEKLKSSEE